MKADTKAADEDDEVDEDDELLAVDAVSGVASVVRAALMVVVVVDEDEEVVDSDSVGNMEGTVHLSYKISLLILLYYLTSFPGLSAPRPRDLFSTQGPARMPE